MENIPPVAVNESGTMPENNASSDRPSVSSPTIAVLPAWRFNMWSKKHTLSLVILLVILGAIPIAAKFEWRATTAGIGFGMWIGILIILILVMVVIGHGVVHRYSGVYIDERNKMSLSRFQLLLWTLVIISALLAMVFLNIISGQTNPADILVPDPIWALLGISVGTAVAQPIINSNTASNLADQGEKNRQIEQMQKMAGETKEAITSKVIFTGQLVKNCDPSQATISNLFRGDEIGNFLSIDFSKVQSFLFTFLVVLGYGAAIGNQVISTTALHSLPSIGTNIAALIGVSQGGYLLYKAAPHSTTPLPS